MAKGEVIELVFEPDDTIEGTCSVCKKKFSSTSKSYGGKVVLTMCPSCYHYRERMT